MSLMMKVGLDSRAWDVGMKKLRASTANWARSTAQTFAGQVAGMMAIQSIASGIQSMYVGAEETLDAAITYDTTTDNIQRLAQAAAKARMPVDRLMDAIKDLSVKQNDALNGSKTWMETLGRFGVTMEDLQNNTPLEMFQQLSRAVSEGVMPDRVMQAEIDNLMSDPGHDAFSKMRQGLFNDLSNLPVTFSREEIEDMAKTSAQARDLMNMSKAYAAQGLQASIKYGSYGLAYRAIENSARFAGSMLGVGPQNTAAKEAREQADSDNLQAIADGVNKMSQ